MLYMWVERIFRIPASSSCDAAAPAVEVMLVLLVPAPHRIKSYCSLGEAVARITIR